MSEPRLPRVEGLLLRLVRGPGAEFVVGDIVERFQDDLAAGVPPRTARRRLRRQAVSALFHSWRSAEGGRRGAALEAGGRRGAHPDGRGPRLAWLRQDLSLALRGLRRRPGFAAGVAVTMGLGIGATTAIFAIVDGVLLRPLDYRDSQRLVAVGTTFPTREWRDQEAGLQALAGTSILNFGDLEARARSFERIAAVEPWSMLLADRGDGPELLQAAAVSEHFFDVLGVVPVLGRGFSPADHAADAPDALLITYGAWQRRFGGEPGVIGRPLDRVGTPTTIVGVLPRGYEAPEAFFGETPQLWAPLRRDHARYAQRGRRSAYLLGRLADGVTVEEARTEGREIAGQLARDFPDGNVYPDGSWLGLGVNELRAETVGPIGRTLWIFLGASALLLLLAALNAATLLLTRSLDRSKELGLRVALGAGRRRLLSMLLVEGAVLSAAGCLVGVALAGGGVQLFRRFAPATIPRLDSVAVDTRVLAAAALVSLAIGLAAALLPALRVTRRAPWRHLGTGRRAAPESGSRGMLVAGQLALAVPLLVAAGLLFGSFLAIRSVEPGFRPEGLSSMNVAVKRPGSPEGEQAWQAWDDVLARVASVGGVDAVAGTSNPPYQDPSWAPRILLPDDAPDVWREGIAGYSVTPGYLDVVGTRLLAGRGLDDGDGPDDPPVALVNEAFVRTVLDGEEPLGLRLRHVEGDDALAFTVVGVVEDVVQARADQGARPAVYFPHTQVDWPWIQVVVRTSMPFDAIVPELRRAVAGFNPYVPPRDVQTLEARMAGTRTTPRFQALLFALFAATALSIAAAGLHGSLAQLVGRRRRELGVRMALGAGRSGLVGLVLAEGVRLTLVGLALGLVAALASSRLLRGFLYEVSPADPVTLAIVSAALLVTCGVACALPARRAVRVDPVVVLREE